MKKLIIVHGWADSPKGSWFPWLQREAEKEGFQVHVPAMPDPDHPKIQPWVATLSRVVKDPDHETFLVGHSVGCQTILRYLETLPQHIKIGGVIFVGGWFSLTSLETEEEQNIAQPWIETPINFKKIKKMIPQVVAIFSDNDPWVSLHNADVMKKELSAHVIIEKSKGHFLGSDGVTELPVVLQELLALVS